MASQQTPKKIDIFDHVINFFNSSSNIAIVLSAVSSRELEEEIVAEIKPQLIEKTA